MMTSPHSKCCFYQIEKSFEKGLSTDFSEAQLKTTEIDAQGFFQHARVVIVAKRERVADVGAQHHVVDQILSDKRGKVRRCGGHLSAGPVARFETQGRTWI